MMQKARKNRNISIWKWDIIMNRKHSLINENLKDHSTEGRLTVMG